MGLVSLFKYSRIRTSVRKARSQETASVIQEAFSLKKYTLTAIVLCLLSVALWTVSTKNTAFVESIRHLTLNALSPLTQTVQTVTASFSKFGGYFSSRTQLLSEIDMLRRQNANLLKWQEVAKREAFERKKLASLVGMVKAADHTSVTTRISSRSTDGFYQSLIVSGAEESGFSKNQPVLNQQGLLGRLIRVGSHNSQVLLLTDSNARVPIEIESTGLQGIVYGNNSNLLAVSLQGYDDKVRVGDRLVSSGYGGVFPKGVPVATVVSVTEDKILARPLATPEQSDLVIVVTQPSPGVPYYSLKEKQQLQ